MFRALLDPRWQASTPEEVERVQRYNVYSLAMSLNKLPEEIENMDAAWYQDIIIFQHTESLASRVRGGK